MKNARSSDSNPVCNLKCHFYVNAKKKKMNRIIFGRPLGDVSHWMRDEITN